MSGQFYDESDREWVLEGYEAAHQQYLDDLAGVDEGAQDPHRVRWVEGRGFTRDGTAPSGWRQIGAAELAALTEQVRTDCATARAHSAAGDDGAEHDTRHDAGRDLAVDDVDGAGWQR